MESSSGKPSTGGGNKEGRTDPFVACTAQGHERPGRKNMEKRGRGFCRESGGRKFNGIINCQSWKQG